MAGILGAGPALVFGGFLCVGLLFLVLAGTITLSLISIFPQDGSVAGFGEEYRHDAMVLKLLYSNVSGGVFFNGTIDDSVDFSNYACNQLINNGDKNIMGCVLENGAGWGPGNTSTSNRRRRAAVTVGLYAIYTLRLFFSNECIKKSDRNKTQNSTQLSACVKQRLTYCNSLVNDDLTPSSTTFKQWSPSPTFAINVYSYTTGSYQSVSPTTVYGVPRIPAANIANSLNFTAINEYYINRGCRYVGGLSLSDISADIAAD